MPLHINYLCTFTWTKTTSLPSQSCKFLSIHLWTVKYMFDCLSNLYIYIYIYIYEKIWNHSWYYIYLYSFLSFSWLNTFSWWFLLPYLIKVKYQWLMLHASLDKLFMSFWHFLWFFRNSNLPIFLSIRLLYDWANFPFLKLGSYLPKKLVVLLQWKPFKNDQNWFYFLLKAFFTLKIFKFLPRLFWSCKEMDWRES